MGGGYFLLMGRTHCAHRYFLLHSLRFDAPVRDTALRALVAGDAVGQDLPHDGLLAFFRDLAIALNPRFERRPFPVSERSAKVRCGMALSSCLMVACPASLRD